MTEAMKQRIFWVVWPAFLVAGMIEMLVFSMVDPHDMTLPFGIELSRLGVYTLAFFSFWLLAALSSALTVCLARSPWEVNRCPLPVTERPEGCPKRADSQAVSTS